MKKGSTELGLVLLTMKYSKHFVLIMCSSTLNREKLSQNKGKVNHGEHKNKTSSANSSFGLSIFHFRKVFDTFSAHKNQGNLFSHERSEIFLSAIIFCTIIERRSMGFSHSLYKYKWLRAMPRSCGIIDVQHFTLITGISGILLYMLGKRVQ
jgi:hypothetical protein